MKPLSSLKYMQLTMFSTPVYDRLVYKLIKKHKFRSILEVGLESGTRSEMMIRVAEKFGASPNVRFTGVDQFDARDKGQSQLPLIDMHRRLKLHNAKTQLVPGDIQSAISRIANSHVRTDLIVIAAGFDAQALETSWFYFPRMLHAASIVLVQNEAGQEFNALGRLEVEKLAEKVKPRRAAA